MSDENRLFLKIQLKRLIDNLNFQEALSTQRQSEIDVIIRRLEKINPNPQPLTSENLSKLLADWQVLYSTNRNYTPIGNLTSSTTWGGINVKIRQNLTLDNTVLVKLKTFAFGVTRPLLPFLMLPELKITLFDFFNNEKFWRITYIDDDTLFGRDDTGTLFVFYKII
ncbi:MAG: PAP/fibrillin family protein [Rivularia sp. ALOHA_DT_140]|nr:PAP/fibrillin family protein [Rivularia sp. ALOHA_DT_140]